MAISTAVAATLAVMVLSAAAAAAAADAPAEKIGMPNCVTSCGDVEVPFPFGMGADTSCYMPGFNLTCDRSHRPPRLLLGEHLRVASIYSSTTPMFQLEVIRTVNLSTGWFDPNDDGSLGAALTAGGPYRLSRSNELVLTGCNVRATLLRNRGNVTISGCFSFCDAYAGEGADWRILHSCRAPIFMGDDNQEEEEEDEPIAAAAPYMMHVSWFGWNMGLDRARTPVRAFIAREGWFDDWLSSYSTSSDYPSTLEVPAYLDCGIGFGSPCLLGSAATNPCKSDHSVCINYTTSISCQCKYDYVGNAYFPDGCKVVDLCKSITCYGECIVTEGKPVCRCPPGTHGNAAMPGGCVNSTVTDAGNCTRLCGGVLVPYPFGIQDMGPAAAHCYHRGFNLTCDATHDPPRLLLGDDGKLRVEKIHLDNATVRALYPGAFVNITVGVGESFVFDDNGFPSHGEAPYSISASNELVLTGCDAQAAMLGHHNGGGPAPDFLSGCVSFCKFDFNERFESNGSYIHRNRSRSRSRSPNDKYCHGMGCCQAHISTDSMGGMPKQLSVAWVSGVSQLAEKTRPPALVFVAAEGWYDELGFSGELGSNRQPPTRAMQEVPIILQWEVLSDKPNCTSSHNICNSEHSYCNQGDRGYTCHCQEGYDGNPYVDDSQGCKGRRHKSKIIGISVGAGLASAAGLIILVLIGRFISNKVKHRKAQMLKRKFFDQNRGQLLQQLVSQRADIAERMIIPLEELEKATNNFDKARELGGGGHGTVYKGILSDLHVVAIKKPKRVLRREIDEFINEVAILSQINHINVVKLYGCCLETEVPMLVYEFISNGTLYDHLHIDGPRSLSWDDRLRIGIESAKSLAYLHSTTSIPIIHRDVKSVNILLDDTLTTKVADFGASRYISVEKSGLTTMVQGTIGYLDPMYFYTGRLTEKSDVYSYGVMLIELLTRKKPFSYSSSEGEGLVAHFVTLFEEGNLSEILDHQVTDEGGKEVEEVVALAVACVKLRGEERPTMRQVELTLEGLRQSKDHDIGVNKLKNNGTMINYPSTVDGRRNNEGSARQYSMEAELTMSSKYPR